MNLGFRETISAYLKEFIIKKELAISGFTCS